MRFVCQDVLEQLIAGSSAYVMQHVRLDIQGLLASRERKPIQGGGASRLVLSDSNGEMGICIGKREDM